MDYMQNYYNKWRKEREEAARGTDIHFTCDSGEESTRKDFSEYVGLSKIISFDAMLRLEKNY